MKIRKIKSLTRDKINYSSRKNYLRLDKNERVNSFDEKLFKKIKISSFDLTAYPETGKIYKYLSNYLKTPKAQLILIPGSDFGLRICFEYFCNSYRLSGYYICMIDSWIFYLIILGFGFLAIYLMDIGIFK